jgi:hypothetical protein
VVDAVGSAWSIIRMSTIQVPAAGFKLQVTQAESDSFLWLGNIHNDQGADAHSVTYTHAAFVEDARVEIRGFDPTGLQRMAAARLWYEVTAVAQLRESRHHEFDRVALRGQRQINFAGESRSTRQVRDLVPLFE